MSLNRGQAGIVDPVIRPGRNPSASRLEMTDKLARNIIGAGTTKVSYRNGRIVIGSSVSLNYSQFCFGFSISATTVTIIGGDWPIGTADPLELSDTDVAISQDLQYVGLQVDTINKTISVIGPSTSKAFFKPDEKVFRTWLHQFNYSGGSVSLKKTHLGSLFMPSTFGATP